MHICFVTSEYPKANYPHGGVGTFVQTLARTLVMHGHEVSVVGLNYYSAYEVDTDEGVHIYRLKPSKVKGVKWWIHNKAFSKQIANIHKNQPIDVVECSELGLAFLDKIPNVNYVIRMHGGHHFFAESENRSLDAWKAYQEKRSFKKADHIVAVSNYVGERTRTLLGLKNRRITVIHNPINTAKFYQSDVRKIEAHSIFFAGTIIEKKGIRQLVQALDHLIDDYPNLKLYIAGRDANLPGTNTPYRPVLEAAISEKARPHIKFLGLVPNSDIPKFIERSNVCCYPSHMEAMPVAWLEVLAMGKTFIGSVTGPGPEAVSDGTTGFLVNPLDPKAIADAIRMVFENPEKAQAVGKNARKDVLDKYDIEQLILKNIDFYSSVSN